MASNTNLSIFQGHLFVASNTNLQGWYLCRSDYHAVARYWSEVPEERSSFFGYES